MKAITRSLPDEHSRTTCRDAIERFLDRSWVLERTPLPTLQRNRAALVLLDDWLHRHRTATLARASSTDVRALFASPHWDIVSRRCESLLGLTTRFFQNLCENKFRPDDPIVTLIDEELAVAGRARRAGRNARRAPGAPTGLRAHVDAVGAP